MTPFAKNFIILYYLYNIIFSDCQFIRMAPILAGISIFLSLIAFIFFIVGCIGNSTEKSIIKNVSWIYYDHNHVETWFGLQKSFSIYHINGQSVDYDVNYDKCKGNDDDFVTACKTCDRVGPATVGLLAISVILSFFCMISNGIGLVNEEAPAKVAGIILSFLTFLFSVIAVGIFMNQCYNDIGDEYYINKKYLTYGPGSVLATFGFLCMILVCILNIINLAMGGGNSYAEPSTSNTEQTSNNEPEYQTEAPQV